MDSTPVISHFDALRLRSLLASNHVRGLDCSHLMKKLRRARIVDAADLPPDRVALGSTVFVCERNSNVCWMYTVVMPAQAHTARRRISVLSALGATLLGQRSGDEIEWRLVGGSVKLIIGTVRNGRSNKRTSRSSPQDLLLA
jgi:regulator of nucleoside diphosphate kinase